MIKAVTNKRESWNTIILYLIILISLSSISYFAILKLNPASIFVGLLMMCPALASIITLRIKGRSVKNLPWKLKKNEYLFLSYIIPVLYITIAYLLIWLLGYGTIFNTETLIDWSKELGITNHKPMVIVIMVVLLATVGVLKNIGSTLGEEIGWRGFFIWELRKVMSFNNVSIVSGMIWSAWHWPIIIYYGGGNTLLQITAFTIMILGISVILNYYTFKANSLWPAALFHSVHNIFIQKIFTPLTIANDATSFWIDEYGIMLPLITTVFAVYFWKKAKAEQL
ncbi:MAG: CPBP family intramembrane metalloprotease [Flavobacterium sp.]|nr:MAG: CPBP family intramembrane metalloprotease [Flavobacterium sp.]